MQYYLELDEYISVQGLKEGDTLKVRVDEFGRMRVSHVKMPGLLGAVPGQRSRGTARTRFVKAKRGKRRNETAPSEDDSWTPTREDSYQRSRDDLGFDSTQDVGWDWDGHARGGGAEEEDDEREEMEEEEEMATDEQREQQLRHIRDLDQVGGRSQGAGVTSCPVLLR